jgi:nucleotide-binding universal stress UspA family protein
MYQHILIATDGTEPARKGLDHGLALAKSAGAKVTIVTVTERFPIYSSADWVPGPTQLAEFDAKQKEGATKLLAASKAVADGLGVKAETVHVSDAYAAEAILETAKSRHCDLIVMASHGRRGLDRLLLGSQTAEVVTRSAIPVLVVR